ncbi:hypothetical protein [Rhizobium mongolense]|uniref:Uncharacterized protein n=2 Tax=Rhizobium mongolense TaxID=57676 RepID=A0ABR6IN43_9HYPH|nr:hypothetical protein [Rhizobium mongolense]MBB4229307.1 hypothetical protein [Rhizobium mongolense]TVZ63145.1 hypothetical protein BCL32_3266 [Rhizobium mongolense USDA 1844]
MPTDDLQPRGDTSRPTSLTLSELIDSGYSQYFAVQLNLDSQIDDPDFFVFDEEDRRRWGDTVMFRDREIALGDDVSPITGYASRWISPLFRLICVEPASARIANYNRDDLLAFCRSSCP